MIANQPAEQRNEHEAEKGEDLSLNQCRAEC